MQPSRALPTIARKCGRRRIPGRAKRVWRWQPTDEELARLAPLLQEARRREAAAAAGVAAAAGAVVYFSRRVRRALGITISNWKSLCVTALS